MERVSEHGGFHTSVVSLELAPSSSPPAPVSSRASLCPSLCLNPGTSGAPSICAHSGALISTSGDGGSSSGLYRPSRPMSQQPPLFSLATLVQAANWSVSTAMLQAQQGARQGRMVSTARRATAEGAGQGCSGAASLAADAGPPGSADTVVQSPRASPLPGQAHIPDRTSAVALLQHLMPEARVGARLLAPLVPRGPGAGPRSGALDGFSGP